MKKTKTSQSWWGTASLQRGPRLGSARLWKDRELASRAPRRPPIRTEPLLSRTTSGTEHFHIQAKLWLSYLPTRSLSCTYTLVCTHKGHTCTLSSFTHKHSLKQSETSETSPKVGGEGHSTVSVYALLSFLVKLQQQSQNSIHHPLLVNDLPFESHFPLPVPEKPETLGGPHPLGLNNEGGGKVQTTPPLSPLHPPESATSRCKEGEDSQRKCLVKESEKWPS